MNNSAAFSIATKLCHHHFDLVLFSSPQNKTPHQVQSYSPPDPGNHQLALCLDTVENMFSNHYEIKLEINITER